MHFCNIKETAGALIKRSTPITSRSTNNKIADIIITQERRIIINTVSAFYLSCLVELHRLVWSLSVTSDGILSWSGHKMQIYNKIHIRFHLQWVSVPIKTFWSTTTALMMWWGCYKVVADPTLLVSVDFTRKLLLVYLHNFYTYYFVTYTQLQGVTSRNIVIHRHFRYHTALTPPLWMILPLSSLVSINRISTFCGFARFW